MRLSNLLLVSNGLVAVLAQAPTPPSSDPFYAPPGNVSKYKPGQVIRSRQVKPKLSGLATYNITAAIAGFHQYLYRTTDTFGDPVTAVTSLMVPKKPDPSKLLAYPLAYDTSHNDCSSSYILQAASGNSTDEIILIAAALNNGWYVVSPDYEGLQAEFTAGVQAGLATLDSIRAVLNEGHNIGLSARAKYAMWGYSGGSLACGWAAELQPHYAPELNFQGAALGGLLPNITNMLLTINNGTYASLSFDIIQGLAAAFPGLAKYIDRELISSMRAGFKANGLGCLPNYLNATTSMDLFSYFHSGTGILTDPVPRSILETAGQMGTHGVPTMPLFAYKAVGDEISPVADLDELFKLYCQKGVTIEYHKDTIGEHISEGLKGGAVAISWIADRLSGVAVDNEGKCVEKYVSLTGADIAKAPQLGKREVAALQALLASVS